MTKKKNYDNMQMSFRAKIAKNPLKSLFLLQNMMVFALRTYLKPSKLSLKEILLMYLFSPKNSFAYCCNLVFGYNLSNIHHVSMKICGEVYFYEF